MIVRILKYLFSLSLLSGALQAQTAQPFGAWRQSGIKWAKPPAELQLSERTAESAVLYFGTNHEFVLVYANVIQGPKSEGLSHGDGQVVYLGKWELAGAILKVEYQLVSRTVLKANETMPGPMENGTLQLKGGVLRFDNMRFHRDERLDNDLLMICRRERARLSP